MKLQGFTTRLHLVVRAGHARAGPFARVPAVGRSRGEKENPFGNPTRIDLEGNLMKPIRLARLDRGVINFIFIGSAWRRKRSDD